MEWVETTGKTVDEAISLALDQLGVSRDEADVEVLDEPKSGLFGRVRGEARVRARVQPTKPRAKDEGRDRKRPASRTPREKVSGDPAASPESVRVSESASDRSETPSGMSRPRRDMDIAPLDGVPSEIEAAGTGFLSGLVGAMGLEATVECGVVNANMIEFRLIGRDLGVLIGPKAQTLQATQELLRTVVHYETQSSSGRILLDVAGYREKRRAALITFTQRVAADVVAAGERRSLEAMSPADRKVIHDAINEIEGVRSSSEGEEPNRYVVLLPA